jgi:hypothetical protein
MPLHTVNKAILAISKAVLNNDVQELLVALQVYTFSVLWERKFSIILK